MAATPLTRNFLPNLSKSEFEKRYPALDPDETLENFYNHHISSGTQAHDWTEKFLGFAAYRQAQAAARQTDTNGTDSMGLPLDGSKRATMQTSTEGDYGVRFFGALERHLQEGMAFDAAHAAAIAELEGEGNG